MMGKNSAVGMCWMAGEFADCARLVAENSASGKPADMIALPKNNLVFCYLIGHALELTYKAILVEHGTTEAHLKDIGHDLLQSRQEADQCIEEGVATLEHGTTQKIVTLISLVYEKKVFEYHKTGLYTLPPDPGEVVEATNNTAERVETYIKKRFQQRKAHER